MDLILKGVNEDVVFMMNPEEVRKTSEDLKKQQGIDGNKNHEQGSSSSAIVPLDHPDLRKMDDEEMKDFLRSRGDQCVI